MPFERGKTAMQRHIGILAATALLIPTVATAQNSAPAYSGETAVLSVVNVSSQPTGCHVGLRLTNNLSYPIDMFVFDIAAYTEKDVVFEELSVSFLGIKPTLDQYQKVRVSGITCDKVTRLKVHGGDRCRMGPYARMSFDRGECLKKVVVEESALIRISK
jgi:hypothetical protein